MKKLFATGIAMLLSMALLTGCGQGGKEEVEEEPAQQCYPVSINGQEIRVGETTVQTLLDQGLSVTVSEMDSSNHITTYEIDPETELEANSYYSGATVTISDSIFAHIAMVTEEEAVRMGDAVIAYLEFYLKGTAEERDVIEFNGVPVSEITQEKALEMFPDFRTYDNHMRESGTDYEYKLYFSQQDGLMNEFTLRREYDIDWSSGN
ncbi:MAG: hypothetical protein NC417_00500 [Candidatus Gastranaerophilales bacterium]|nr:hypothetical protein [Candidatus Gastranaerophilales bacterium]